MVILYFQKHVNKVFRFFKFIWSKYLLFLPLLLVFVVHYHFFDYFCTLGGDLVALKVKYQIEVTEDRTITDQVYAIKLYVKYTY